MMREGNIFRMFTLVVGDTPSCQTGGVPPSQVWTGEGVPHPRTRWGLPHPANRGVPPFQVWMGGYPILSQGRGVLNPADRGYPIPRWGYPILLTGSTPIQDQDGSTWGTHPLPPPPPSRLDGGSPPLSRTGWMSLPPSSVLPSGERSA